MRAREGDEDFISTIEDEMGGIGHGGSAKKCIELE